MNDKPSDKELDDYLRPAFEEWKRTQIARWPEELAQAYRRAHKIWEDSLLDPTKPITGGLSDLVKEKK